MLALACVASARFLALARAPARRPDGTGAAPAARYRPPPVPAPSDKRERAREARLAAESGEAEAARRQRLIALLGGAALLAVIVVVALVALSQGGEDDDTSAAPTAVLEEVPEEGIALGDPDAPVTMVEFADPQCPFCADYTTEVLPDLVEKYVATGEVRMELQLLTFIGEDSLRLANAGYAATEQEGLWKFMDLAYARQGAENSGYADDAFIESIATDAGLDPEPLLVASANGAPDTQVGRLIEAARTAAGEAGVASTPSFLIGPTGGELEPLEVTSLDVGAFEGPIDDAIAAPSSSG